jgi:hypothetical protein
VDATAALKMAGRLARDRGTGRGLVAAAKFGGGTAAIPPLPVAARTKRQFLVDSLIALACLAVVLIVAFRLIVTRRPAAAGVPGVWPSPGAPGGRAGPPDSRGPGGWAGAVPPDSYAPGGWAGAAPPDSYAPGGWAGAAPSDPGAPDLGPQEPGLPDPAASSAGGAWSDGSETGYGRSASYWAPGGYKPSAGYPSPSGYGSSDGFQPPADPGPPAGSGPAAGSEPAGGHEWPAGDVQGAGYGLPQDPGLSAPKDLGSHAGDPPAADDDTWPASGQW